MRVADGDVRQAAMSLEHKTSDVFLSLQPIPEDVRESLASRDVMWIDIARKQQSRVSNDLGNEVSAFLKRYGVRTLRYPRIAHASRAAEA